MWTTIFWISLLVVLGYLYEKYSMKQINNAAMNKNDLIQEFLMNNTSLNGGKPIVWVHVDHSINARSWFSFGSRNSNQINNPYLYITIKSIINSVGDDYNVCLIDDTSFTKLLSNWNVQVNNLADPVKSHIRSLAMMKLLYVYGGVVVPSSYLSLTNLSQLTSKSQHSMFVVEDRDRAVTSTYVDFFPSHKFIGCGKECEEMKELIEFTEQLVSKDFTSEMDFLGQINRKLFAMKRENKLSILDGSHIGIKDIDGKIISIDELCGTSHVAFSDKLNGILIPSKDVNIRVKYQWFGRMSPKQLVESDMIISQYIQKSK